MVKHFVVPGKFTFVQYGTMSLALPGGENWTIHVLIIKTTIVRVISVSFRLLNWKIYCQECPLATSGIHESCKSVECCLVFHHNLSIICIFHFICRIFHPRCMKDTLKENPPTAAAVLEKIVTGG